MKDKTTLACAVRIARTLNGGSLIECSNDIGISQSYLWMIEDGRKTNPTFGVLSAVLTYFKIDFDSLIPPDISAK